MPREDRIPKEFWDPLKVNEFLAWLKNEPIPPTAKKKIYAEWAQMVGVKMTHEQAKYLLGGG